MRFRTFFLTVSFASFRVVLRALSAFHVPHDLPWLWHRSSHARRQLLQWVRPVHVSFARPARGLHSARRPRIQRSRSIRHEVSLLPFPRRFFPCFASCTFTHRLVRVLGVLVPLVLRHGFCSCAQHDGRHVLHRTTSILSHSCLGCLASTDPFHSLSFPFNPFQTIPFIPFQPIPFTPFPSIFIPFELILWNGETRHPRIPVGSFFSMEREKTLSWRHARTTAPHAESDAA